VNYLVELLTAIARRHTAGMCEPGLTSKREKHYYEIVYAYIYANQVNLISKAKGVNTQTTFFI
jgi:hypothetical protein